LKASASSAAGAKALVRRIASTTRAAAQDAIVLDRGDSAERIVDRAARSLPRRLAAFAGSCRASNSAISARATCGRACERIGHGLQAIGSPVWRR
jgi:predicted TIM-barrel enzyme